MLWEAGEVSGALVNLEIFLQLFVYQAREIAVADKISGSYEKIKSATSLELLESQKRVPAHLSTFHFLFYKQRTRFSIQINETITKAPASLLTLSRHDQLKK